MAVHRGRGRGGVASTSLPRCAHSLSPHARGRRQRQRQQPRCYRLVARAQSSLPLVKFERSDILVNKQVGSLSLQVSNDFESVKQEFVGAAGATVRIYTGEITAGEHKDSEVILKEYPYIQGESFSELAKNEIRAHEKVQRSEGCANICLLLGTYEGRIGEQWLVFDSSSIYPVSYWAELASKKGLNKQNWSLLNLLDPEIDFHRRQAFIFSIIKGAIKGMAGLHKLDILHTNISPDSVVLSTVDEKQGSSLQVKLRELSFSVSVTEASLRGGGTLAELWEADKGQDQSIDIREEHEKDLWRRATKNGCTNYFQKKNFGIADDIYQMGLLVLFVLFKSASNPETSLDMLTLKRYVEITFSGNIKEEFRDFMKADQEFAATIEWLDEHDGWGLIEAMLHQDWKQRPTADSCLMHPFLKQTLKYK